MKMAESLTLYKLIILYMLNKVTFPLTNSQLSDFILGQEYTTYFHLQQAINEMLEANLLKVEVIRNSSRYHMTAEGRQTLGYFENQIPDAIKEDILQYLEQHSYEMRNEVSVWADYDKVSGRTEYDVHCQVKEAESILIDLHLSVPEENLAQSLCRSWSKKSQEIYEHIMKELMS